MSDAARQALAQMVPIAQVALVVSALGTALVLWLSRRLRVVDVPNERSAHVRPTPTLGGLAIVAGILAAGVVAGLRGPVAAGAGAGLAILLLAAWDDLGRPLGVGGKLALQGLACLAWVALGPSLGTLNLPWVGGVDPGPWGALLSTCWLLWSMNVYNFMDGIDGLTATQSLAIGGAQVACLLVAGSPEAGLPLLTAAAVAGFLPFNAPPARLFMGDVGALSLGFLLGIGGLLGASAAAPDGVSSVWVVLPLTGYAVDTTHTLLRRAWRGENILRAHRQHLYQRLVEAGWSHGRVDAVALAVTLGFALAAWLGVRGQTAAAVAAAVPSVALLVAGVVWKERRFRG